MGALQWAGRAPLWHSAPQGSSGECGLAVNAAKDPKGVAAGYGQLTALLTVGFSGKV